MIPPADKKKIFLVEQQIKIDKIVEKLFYHRTLDYAERQALTTTLADLFKLIETVSKNINADDLL